MTAASVYTYWKVEDYNLELVLVCTHNQHGMEKLVVVVKDYAFFLMVPKKKHYKVTWFYIDIYKLSLQLVIKYVLVHQQQLYKVDYYFLVVEGITVDELL